MWSDNETAIDLLGFQYLTKAMCGIVKNGTEVLRSISSANWISSSMFVLPRAASTHLQH
jgi:hypothetical protein